jgi:hypothetical protein
MMRSFRFAAVILAAATAASAMGRRPPKQEEPAPAAPPAKAAPAAPTESTMTIHEWKGQHGGPITRGHMPIDDEATWKAVWRELGQDAPPLDFSKYVAVAVFVGERPTGGFTAVFDEPAAKGDDLLVRYTIPAPTGFTTQAFTQPWKVRAFPRPKGRVILEYHKP